MSRPSPSDVVTRATDASLATSMAALSSPTRLSILRALRRPLIVSEIEVASAEGQGSAIISRQAVRKHLDALVEARLVSAREVVRERGETVEFSLNHQGIYALAEDIRDLARLRPLVDPAEMTIHRETGRTPPRAPGPSLLVVKGLVEGTSFDISPAGGRTEWVLGRRRGLDIALDYDPFVSSENTRFLWRDGHHVVEALPSSRNGTSLNFEALAGGEARELRHGDLISVGRTTLAYWARA